MCLCLMIYTLAERNFRLQIIKKKETIPNQVGKEVKNPTMRWIFQLFEGITVLYKRNCNQLQTKKLNFKEIHFKILDIFGFHIAKFYST